MELTLSQFYTKIGGEAVMDRAWEIHGIHYGDTEGTVTKEDQEFYDKFVTDLINMDGKPFSVCLWLAFASKYVSK